MASVFCRRGLAMACSLLLMLLGARSAVAAACPTAARVPEDTSRLFLSLAAATGADGAAQSAQPACATSYMACHNISNSQGKNPEYSPSAPSEPVAKQPRNPRIRRGPWSTLFCAQCLVVGTCLRLVSPRFVIARPLPWRVPAARLGGLALRPLTPVLLSAEMPIRTPSTWPLVWPY